MATRASPITVPGTPGGNPDHDGLRNLAEYRHGTEPRDDGTDDGDEADADGSQVEDDDDDQGEGEDVSLRH